MTLPIQPDIETVLESCAHTLREVLLPEIESEWGRYSGDLCVASLEYALGLLKGDRNAGRREELAAAIENLRPEITAADLEEPSIEEWNAALRAPSPFVAASALLVAAQNHPGPLADRVRAGLHPLLHAQLDAEMTAAMPLFAAFARNMVGR
jgi:hypothetical protein